MKNRKEKIINIYDTACKIIDDYEKEKNICGFKNNKCCMQKRYINGCCRCCINQSNNGCTTSNLTCKLYHCDYICKKYKTLKIEDIEILKKLSFRQRLILKYDYFSKREDVINDLYLNSILLFLIRYVYRLIFKKIYRFKYSREK